MGRQWATSQALDESGRPDPHVFQLGAGPVAPQAATSTGFDVSTAELADVVMPPQRAAQPTQAALAAPAATKQTEAKPLNTAEVMRQLKARLRVVEREIKARKSLETERDQIQRLISAAKNERNNLRAIRATG
jgi:hypothetical protein